MRTIYTFIFWLLLFPTAQSEYLGSWKIDDVLSFTTNTHDPSTGAESDADSPPTYRVYEDETGTPIITGTMALIDASNTNGYYSEQITLSAANGLEKGKSYSLRINATVSSIVGSQVHNFQIEAEVDANTVSPTVSADTVTVEGVDATDAIGAAATASLNAYDGPTNTEMLAAFTAIKGATWDAGTDTLEHIRNKQTDIEADTGELQTDWANGGRLDLILDGRASQSSVDIIDGIVDSILLDTGELQTDWADGGRLDLILDAAGSAGDPWVTELPGSYTGTQAGKIIADMLADTNELQTDWANGGRLDLILDARASQSSVDIIDGIVDSILLDTGELQTDWVNGGRLDLILDARASQASVDEVPTNTELATSQAAADDATLAAIAALNNISTVQVNAEVDAAIETYQLDHLLAVAGGSGEVANDSLWAKLVSKSVTAVYSSYDHATDSLEALSDAAGGGGGDGSSYTAIPWNPAWDTEVQSEVADALVSYDGLVPADLPTNFASLGINVSGHLSRVVLVDTLTTYTGNTPQTGDAYAVVNSGTFGNSALKTLLETKASQASVDTIDDLLDTEVGALQTSINTIDDLLDTEVASLLTGITDIQGTGFNTSTDSLAALESIISGVSGQPLSPTFTQRDSRMWRFDAADELTASNTIREFLGFEDLLLAMNLDNVIPAEVTISVVSLLSISPDGNIIVTSPLSVSSNKRQIHAILETCDEAGTYTLVFSITTTDGQTLIRRGTLVVESP